MKYQRVIMKFKSLNRLSTTDFMRTYGWYVHSHFYIAPTNETVINTERESYLKNVI